MSINNERNLTATVQIVRNITHYLISNFTFELLYFLLIGDTSLSLVV